jgi:PAS domain-containing protein
MERLVGIADRTRAWPLWARLGGAALLLGAALAARFVLAGAESGYPYLTFFAAVLLAAVLFGRRVGLLATAAATALALWFFVAPVGDLRVEDPRDAWAALAFAATGLAFVLLASAARRALRERDRANAALRLVLEGIGEPFYVLDADWRFVHASRAALQAWGKAAPEVLGRRYLDAFPEAAGGPIHAAHEEAMRTRRPARLQAVSPVLGRWVEVDIHPAPDGGLSVAFRDIKPAAAGRGAPALAGGRTDPPDQEHPRAGAGHRRPDAPRRVVAGRVPCGVPRPLGRARPRPRCAPARR